VLSAIARQAAHACLPPVSTRAALKYHLELIERSITNKDVSLTMRVLRYASHIRKHIRADELREFVGDNVGSGETAAKALSALSHVAAAEPPAPKAAAGAAASSSSSSSSSGQDEESKEDEKPAKKARKPVPLTAASAPERAMYVGFLVASLAARHGMWEAALAQATGLVDAARELNRRTMDPLAARALQLLGLAAERCGKLVDMQPLLLSLHRTASLRHDACSQAVAVNLVLRALIGQKRFLQAGRLIEHVEAALPLDSPAQLVRFLFAKGRVLAVSARYADADACLTQALRKAPTNTGLGFKQLVQKHAVVVQLLRGKVPDRAVFAGIAGSDGGAPDKAMARALRPYLALTQSVRSGDVEGFSRSVDEHSAQLGADGTLSLVHRLRRTVIRSGLTKITRAYSAIAFSDVAAMLGLSSAEDAEFLCAKAIADGVIRASLDHDAGSLIALSAEDVYATARPKDEFHRRIEFCLDIHADSVRAMRYPKGAFQKDEAALTEARQREEEEAAVSKAIEEHGMGGQDDDDE